MPENVHPGSWVGDSVEEFKKLPTWGKFAVGGLAIFVVYLGYTAYKNRGASGNSQATSLPATSNAPGSSSPFSMVGNSPLLPSNVNPLYDPQGNLVAFQQGGTAPGGQPTSTAPSPTQVGATPNPPSSNPVQAVVSWVARGRMNSVQAEGINIRSTPGGAIVGHIPYGSAVSPTGGAVSGPSNNSQTKGVANSTQWIPVQGGYVSAADVQQQSSSSPAVQQSNMKTQTASNSGAGSESWQSRLRGLRTYTPQYGDNMNEVAAKLNLKGGWQAFGVPSFEHGVPVAIPGIQQNAQGQSVSMPGINIHQSAQGQSLQVGNEQISQGRQ